MVATTTKLQRLYQGFYMSADRRFMVLLEYRRMGHSGERRTHRWYRVMDRSAPDSTSKIVDTLAKAQALVDAWASTKTEIEQ
jgi:hypothetical protein